MSKWNIVIFTLIITIFMCCYGSTLLPSSLAIIPNIWVLLIYSLYFIIGALFAKNIDLFESYFQGSWVYFAVALTALIIDLLLSKLTSQYYLAAFFYCYSSFLFFYCFICACARWHQKENSILRYLSEASYWMYLTQVFFIIKFQEFFSGLNDIFLQWLCTVVLTVIMILFSYDLLIRPKRTLTIIDAPN